MVEEPLPLFVYGSLGDPRVRRSVLGRELREVQPAILPGHRRVRLAGYGYPFVVAEPAGSVEGLLLFGLDAHDYVRLDEYECVSQGEYRRARVEAVLRATGQPVAAHAYLIGPRFEARLKRLLVRS